MGLPNVNHRFLFPDWRSEEMIRTDEEKILELTKQLAERDAQLKWLREDLDRSEVTYRKCRDDMTIKDTEIERQRALIDEAVPLVERYGYECEAAGTVADTWLAKVREILR